MSELNYQTNPDELESSFEAIPAGEYLAVITDSDYTDNKQMTGKILKLTYEIIDGPYKGRKIFNNLNLENQSPQAEQIARKSLNSIGVATGVAMIKDSSQLHDIPMKIDVKVKDDPNYGLQNRIAKHSAIQGSEAPARQPQGEKAPESAAPTTNGNGGKKPWEK